MSMNLGVFKSSRNKITFYNYWGPTSSGALATTVTVVATPLLLIEFTISVLPSPKSNIIK